MSRPSPATEQDSPRVHGAGRRSAPLLLAVSAALLVAAGSLLFWLYGPSGAPVLEPEFQTPAWTLAGDLSGRLHGTPEFAGAAFIVASESPLRFTLTGTVETDEQLNRLKTRAAEVRPEGDYDFDVRVMSGG